MFVEMSMDLWPEKLAPKMPLPALELNPLNAKGIFIYIILHVYEYSANKSSCLFQLF